MTDVEYPGDQPPRKRGCSLGCLLSLVILAIIVVAAAQVVIPLFESGFGMFPTEPVPGDERNFDPIAAVPAVMAYAGEGVQLTEISFRYVRSDGTLDLHANYNPIVTYKFVRQVPPLADAPPIGAGGTSTGLWYEEITVNIRNPGQWYTYQRISGGQRTRISYLNKGMQRDVSTPGAITPQVIPLPTCPLADLWAVAIARNAPASAVAIVTYTEEGYRFRISDVGIDLRFDEDCKPVER